MVVFCVCFHVECLLFVCVCCFLFGVCVFMLRIGTVVLCAVLNCLFAYVVPPFVFIRIFVC